MAREQGLYQRKDSPYWWINVVLPDGRRVCESTRLRRLQDAEEYLVRLKAQAYEAYRSGVKQDRSWPEAVVRYNVLTFDTGRLMGVLFRTTSGSNSCA